MKKIIMSMLAAASIAAPVLADPIKEDEYFTPHATGCMLLQECTDHVQKLKIRQKALSILLSKFGGNLDVIDRKSKYTNQSIYECAHDWVSQGNVNCNGIVKYYEAYYHAESN